MTNYTHHINIHLLNPDINYVKTENCRLCAVAKQQTYGNYADINNRYYLDITFEQHWLTYLHQLALNYNLPIDVNKYKKYKYKFTNTKHIKNIKSSGKNSCTICIDKMKKNDNCVILTNCKHTFHNICLQLWTYHSDSCPLCRTII